MLQLSGFATSASADIGTSNVILRLVTSEPSGITDRRHDAYLYRGGPVPEGYEWLATFEQHSAAVEGAADGKQVIVLPDQFQYLEHGDVIRFTPGRNAVRVMFRTSANANYFLVTERCNHLCLMCSQPPKDIDDSWLTGEILEVLPLLPESTPFLGIPGGVSQTLVGDAFFQILKTAYDCLPGTPVHILSNGRSFSDKKFASRYSTIGHPRLSVGIPLYSADPETHDFVVQSKGAFDETIRGIMNLKALEQEVEIRVVVHKQTYEGLMDLSEFIFRNLTFVDHVTFMGLEIRDSPGRTWTSSGLILTSTARSWLTQ